MNEVPNRLLRETLQARSPEPPQACLDAGTVAAWADDTLSGDERRAAEAHAADCVWCQALVAAMAKTAPPLVARTWWRRPAVGWLVPLTAAAAALLIWINVPQPAPLPSNPNIPREVRQDLPSPTREAASDRPAEAGVPPSGPVNAPAASGSSDPARSADRVAGRTATAQRNEAATDAGTAVDAATASPELQVAMPRPPPPVAPGPASGSVVAPVAQPRPPAAFRGVTEMSVRSLDNRPAATLIVSPTPAIRWRIMPDGVVQHSADGGTTWEAQATGVSVRLTSGASPAPSICWLVGPQGIVLRSTDGRSWQRIAFVETVDLIAIRATDERTATVGAVDGRAFSTTDGGRTWTPAPAF